MITKAIVQSQVPNSNKFRVRIPIFDGPPGGMVSTPDGILAEATLCTLPNAQNVVNPGDIVYVAFENNDMGRPVILGHLYQEPSRTTTCIDLQLRTLKVEDKVNSKVSSAKLPYNTSIDMVTANDMQKLLFYFRNMDNH